MSNTRRNCARENSAGGRSEPTLVGSITNSGTSGVTQRPRHRTPGKSAVDISEPDVVGEVYLERKVVAGISDLIRCVHRSKPDKTRIGDGLTEVVVEDANVPLGAE